jgi:hypothetical protein
MPPSCNWRATVLTEALLTDNTSANAVNDCAGGSQISLDQSGAAATDREWSNGV